MARMIKRREVKYQTLYLLRFDDLTQPGGGFSFDCDKDGCVDESKLMPAGLKNLQLCREGKNNTGPGYVSSYEHKHVDDAVLECDCGHRVVLSDAMTNDCERCGRLYNGSGQALAPRDQWEEEY